MSEERERERVEDGASEQRDVRDDPIVGTEALTRDEFEAAWAGLGADAASAIAEEMARVSARDRAPALVEPAPVEPAPAEPAPVEPARESGDFEVTIDSTDAVPRVVADRGDETSPPRDRSARLRGTPPPPPAKVAAAKASPAKPSSAKAPVAQAPAAKAPSAPTPIPAAKSMAPLPVVVETEAGEPDLLELSRSHAIALPVENAPLPTPAAQLMAAITPRTTERKLMIVLIVLLVAVNGYFLATRERDAAPAREPPVPAAAMTNPAPVAPAPAAPVEPRPAPAPLPPPPTPVAPVVAPPAEPAPIEPAPTEPPVAIEPAREATPAPASPPRAAPPRPRKPRTKVLPVTPVDSDAPAAKPDAAPAEPTPAPTPTPTPAPTDDRPPPPPRREPPSHTG